MPEHYFSKKPQSKSSPKTWTYKLRNKWYTFTSDTGVFSKHEVDFGSKLLIEQFTAPDIEGDLLDLGCGYGPIGIALADHYRDRKVVMTDINERAIQLAKDNAKQNKIDNVEFINSDRFENICHRKFAAILTNPPIRAGKKVVHSIFEESKSALQKDGELWIVIQKKQGAPSAKKKLEDVFGNVQTIRRRKGYYIIKAINV
ncbi:MAG TPA: class I SAM-dependent methyltransferase [Bacillota bacterium]